jgi:hypothetical protein
VNYMIRNHSASAAGAAAVLQRTSVEQQAFHHIISLEQRRAERSKKSFLLLLVDAGPHPFGLGKKILAALMPMTRETDIIGWYKEGTVAGVVFTEIADEDVTTTTTAVMNRVSKTLKNHLSPQQFSNINLSFHLFPEEHDRKSHSLSAASVPHSSAPSFGLVAELQ